MQKQNRTREIYSSGKPAKKAAKVFNAKNFLALLLCLLIGLGGGGLLAVYGTVQSVNYKPVDVGNSNNTTADEDANLDLTNGKLLDDPMVLNIMLFGEDHILEGDDHGRSDTMIMLSIDNRHKKLKMTSFMRDTYVTIPGYGDNKLNASYTFGGASLAIQTIESNFGVNIDRYAVVDFKSFRNIIDVLGGVDMELTAEEIDYINWQTWKNGQADTRYEIQAEPGIVHLNGRQALWYARNRGDAEAGFSGDDFDRTQRQRKLLSTIMSEFKSASLTQIVEIVGQVGPMITTNLKKNEITMLVSNSLTYLGYPLEEFRVPEDDVWQYGWTDDGQSIVEIVDWDKQRYDLAYFVYEDSIIKANPQYATEQETAA